MAWNTLTHVTAFVGMAANVLAAMEAPLGSFQDRIGSVSGIPETVWRTAAAPGTAQVLVPQPNDQQGNPVAPVARNLTPVEVGQVGMLWRLCSRIAWTSSGGVWRDFLDFDVMVDPANRAQVFAVAQPAQPQVGGVLAAAGQKFKMSTVIDQGDDTEYDAPTRAEADAWAQAYFQQEQASPLEEESPNEIQVKGLSVRVTAHRTPYVDFGIWGPYGRKLQRALKFRNFISSGNGTR